MKIVFDLKNMSDLSYLMEYAKNLGVTDFNIMMDAIIKKQAETFRKKSEKTENPTKDMINYNLWENKQDSYFINDFISDKLKFKYGISRYGDVLCFQFGKEKPMKYSIDNSSGNIYVYLLKKGCPNKADIATLQNYSLRINLEEIFDKIYGKDSFKKHAEKHVMGIIEKSQQDWKNRGKRKWQWQNFYCYTSRYK